MNLRCLLFGCRYKQTQGKTENGIFRIKGKCIHCGKEKVLVEVPWEEVQISYLKEHLRHEMQVTSKLK